MEWDLDSYEVKKMANRDKNSWNKGMLVDHRGNKSSKSNQKTCSSTEEKKGSRKNKLNETRVENKTITEPLDIVILEETEDAASAKQLSRKEVSSTDTDRFNPNPKKTPLENFDIKVFFEENLYDIIDLEENRSGVKEFEDAVKKDE